MLRKRNSKISHSGSVSNYIYNIHTSMGDRIRTALESGVSESPTTQPIYDDVGSNEIDPLSDIRTDKFLAAEMSHDNALFAANNPPTEKVTPSTSVETETTVAVENTPSV